MTDFFNRIGHKQTVKLCLSRLAELDQYLPMITAGVQTNIGVIPGRRMQYLPSRIRRIPNGLSFRLDSN